MMCKGLRLWWLLGLFFFFMGCAAKIPHVIVPDYGKRATRLVAVMPVEHGPAETEMAKLLRNQLVDELYYKGYPKIPPKVIDEKLVGVADGGGGKVSPRLLGEILHVDAVLYTTLKEGGTAAILFYAPTTVDVEFELKSARTGESLWRVHYRTTRRNYGFSRKQLELKTSQVFEPAIQEVVNKALSTLPDGPDAIGS
jgi:hypothetical protein